MPLKRPDITHRLLLVAKTEAQAKALLLEAREEIVQLRMMISTLERRNIALRKEIRELKL